MPKKKTKNHIQPSLFDETAFATGDPPAAPLELEPLEPGDVVLVDGDKARDWIVERNIAEFVAIWNDSEHDVIERQRLLRVGKAPDLVEAYASFWLTRLVNTLGYWSMVGGLGRLQPKTACTKDQLHIVGIQYSNSTARYSEVWQYYDSDLAAVEPLVEQLLTWCRDEEVPAEQVLVALYDRYFEGREP